MAVVMHLGARRPVFLWPLILFSMLEHKILKKRRNLAVIMPKLRARQLYYQPPSPNTAVVMRLGERRPVFLWSITPSSMLEQENKEKPPNLAVVMPKLRACHLQNQRTTAPFIVKMKGRHAECLGNIPPTVRCQKTAISYTFFNIFHQPHAPLVSCHEAFTSRFQAFFQ